MDGGRGKPEPSRKKARETSLFLASGQECIYYASARDTLLRIGSMHFASQTATVDCRHKFFFGYRNCFLVGLAGWTRTIYYRVLRGMKYAINRYPMKGRRFSFAPARASRNFGRFGPTRTYFSIISFLDDPPIPIPAYAVNVILIFYVRRSKSGLGNGMGTIQQPASG